MKRLARHMVTSGIAAALLLGAARADAADGSADAPKVELNSATEEQLATLPGIGPAKASAIVKHRAERPFRTAVDLLKVRGIGPSTFRRLRDLVRVEPPAPRAEAKRDRQRPPATR